MSVPSRAAPGATTEDDAVNSQEASTTDTVTIYESDPDEALQALAQLDSARCPSGPVLVAAVGGEPRAALPLEGGRAIADPFHRTAELVSLLEVRLAQINGRSGGLRVASLVGPLSRGYGLSATTVVPLSRNRGIPGSAGIAVEDIQARRPYRCVNPSASPGRVEFLHLNNAGASLMPRLDRDRDGQGTERSA